MPSGAISEKSGTPMIGIFVAILQHETEQTTISICHRKAGMQDVGSSSCIPLCDDSGTRAVCRVFHLADG